MLKQTWKNLLNFFTLSKKNVFSSENTERAFTQTGKDATRKVRLLYHQDADILQTANAKADTQQHDWWIN